MRHPSRRGHMEAPVRVALCGGASPRRPGAAARLLPAAAREEAPAGGDGNSLFPTRPGG
ncbi:hypothetical protein [Streptomyces sp. NPDC019224]|uniref:hypothetical protein n=1 Tax=Streptomyces sp. NPDC019224 TaxID=3154484 RepID=UPI0033F305D0